MNCTNGSGPAAGLGGSGGGKGSSSFANQALMTSGSVYNSTNAPDGSNHSGGEYGGGGGNQYGRGGCGVVRIIWSLTGVTRSFPSTNVSA